jgi:hypothetical protein
MRELSNSNAFVNKIIKDAKVMTPADLLTGNNLFYIERTSPKLSDEARQAFHSNTTELLYLAKRTRVDILLLVSNLCMRVQEPTKDSRKLKEYTGGNEKSTT